MDGDGAASGPVLTTRRYTGTSRKDAEAGFRTDWPALAARFILVAAGWDDATHTLTIMLKPLSPRMPAEQAERVPHPPAD